MHLTLHSAYLDAVGTFHQIMMMLLLTTFGLCLILRSLALAQLQAPPLRGHFVICNLSYFNDAYGA
jgi:hypothetical protein